MDVTSRFLERRCLIVVLLISIKGVLTTLV